MGTELDGLVVRVLLVSHDVVEGRINAALETKAYALAVFGLDDETFAIHGSEGVVNHVLGRVGEHLRSVVAGHRSDLAQRVPYFHFYGVDQWFVLLVCVNENVGVRIDGTRI